jgi:hypothetical protein
MINNIIHRKLNTEQHEHNKFRGKILNYWIDKREEYIPNCFLVKIVSFKNVVKLFIFCIIEVN